ncbi:phosphoribosylformylglycinamidine cyclo-ligase [Acidiferrobacter sp.]|uniref:phosphoribosylformylglycinamidine cyclo-ligase n=1 Tax=Acidiferrobacter sp. TaxID=1872107 RepID=UPI002608A2E4|nr:phosphoribosylformylglycinamidine cyclo-ligase [Acidiferrobacter sp.]
MTDAKTPTPLSYRIAGVDIDAGDALVEALKPIAARTTRPGVLAGLGGFGALFSLSGRYRDPVLVSGTDGVGTKLLLAIALDRHDDIGIDLVAMCANDIVVQGAEPLFFLDYFASGRLDITRAERIIAGIGRGCELAGAALVGGETAEMPGMYRDQDYDLAGFCVGAVERARLIDGSRVKAGDVILGLPSSGLHSNGYSLARAVIARRQADLATTLDGRPLADILLTPTRIYVKALLALHAALDIHAMAHITGGGLPGNVPRVIPSGLRAVIDRASWSWPPIFRWLQEGGAIAEDEMYRTFNCGVGMAVVVDAADAGAAQAILRDHGETPFVMGVIDRGQGEFAWA